MSFVRAFGFGLIACLTLACMPIVGDTPKAADTAPMTTNEVPLAKSTELPYPIGTPVTTAPNGAYPYPPSTLNETEAAINSAKATSTAAVIEMTLTAQPTPIRAPTLNSQELTAWIQGYKDAADISLKDNGKTLTYTLYTRFFVFLDDDKYPRSTLRCEPNWVMGEISNGSFRGPDLYPSYLEATVLGTCTLKSNDFGVTIVVIEPTPVTPSPP